MRTPHAARLTHRLERPDQRRPTPRRSCGRRRRRRAWAGSSRVAAVSGLSRIPRLGIRIGGMELRQLASADVPGLPERLRRRVQDAADRVRPRHGWPTCRPGRAAGVRARPANLAEPLYLVALMTTGCPTPPTPIDARSSFGYVCGCGGSLVLVTVRRYPALQLAAGWHGIGQLGAAHILGAVFALLAALAVVAWWIEARSTVDR